ncbi:hypothetical protein [Streptomyces sp. IBSBF 2435]
MRTKIESRDQVLRERREAEEAFGDGQAALEELRVKVKGRGFEFSEVAS